MRGEATLNFICHLARVASRGFPKARRLVVHSFKQFRLYLRNNAVTAPQFSFVETAPQPAGGKRCAFSEKEELGRLAVFLKRRGPGASGPALGRLKVPKETRKTRKKD